MRISNLIKQLNHIKEHEGDLIVKSADYDSNLTFEVSKSSERPTYLIIL